ncbi:hypothetical protein APHAL10511_004183 [Amanita phalloides]|nr:hypothetical protein APHAL10511_004183 [Amanita phalloides]
MHTILRLNTMVVAALFLLYILVQRRATAASLQEDKHAINVGNVPWNQLSRYVSDGATVTFSNLENVAWNAIQLPSLEKIAAYANELLKVINEDLNNAASELHIQEKIEDFRSTFRDIVSASSEMRGHMTELTRPSLKIVRRAKSFKRYQEINKTRNKCLLSRA